jgi:hypothetical protein
MMSCLNGVLSGTRAGVLAGILTLLLGFASLASANCNCAVEGECSYDVCCYTNGTCIPSGEGQRCAAVWDDEGERYHCSAGDACSAEPCGV